jgi:hypothetical protein
MILEIISMAFNITDEGTVLRNEDGCLANKNILSLET